MHSMANIQYSVKYWLVKPIQWCIYIQFSWFAYCFHVSKRVSEQLFLHIESILCPIRAHNWQYCNERFISSYANHSRFIHTTVLLHTIKASGHQGCKMSNNQVSINPHACITPSCWMLPNCLNLYMSADLDLWPQLCPFADHTSKLHMFCNASFIGFFLSFMLNISPNHLLLKENVYTDSLKNICLGNSKHLDKFWESLWSQLHFGLILSI